MKTKTIAATVFVLTLAACGSSKDASNENFEKALNTHYATNCITLTPGWTSDSHGYPATIELQKKTPYISQALIDQNNANMTRPMDILVKAGVLSVSDGTKTVKQMFGNGTVTVPTKVYALTDQGKKVSVGPDSTSLCVGHFKVDEVVRFTQPNNAMGQTISEVSFTTHAVDVPEWAKNPDVSGFYAIAKGLGDVRVKATRTLVLASDGWIDSNDFSK